METGSSTPTATPRDLLTLEPLPWWEQALPAWTVDRDVGGLAPELHCVQKQAHKAHLPCPSERFD